MLRCTRALHAAEYAYLRLDYPHDPAILYWQGARERCSQLYGHTLGLLAEAYALLCAPLVLNKMYSLFYLIYYIFIGHAMSSPDAVAYYEHGIDPA